MNAVELFVENVRRLKYRAWFSKVVYALAGTWMGHAIVFAMNPGAYSRCFLGLRVNSCFGASDG